MSLSFSEASSRSNRAAVIAKQLEIPQARGCFVTVIYTQQRLSPQHAAIASAFTTVCLANICPTIANLTAAIFNTNSETYRFIFTYFIETNTYTISFISRPAWWLNLPPTGICPYCNYNPLFYIQQIRAVSKSST
jgi:hypothetical protein